MSDLQILDANQVIGGFSVAAMDVVDGLIGRYRQARQNIDRIVEMTGGDAFKSVAHHFFNGNADEQRGRVTLEIKKLFDPAGAVANLNACYWQEVMSMTDVYDAMPQKRREEWNAMIREPLGVKRDKYDKDFTTPPLPEFEEQTVRSTLQGLLMSRSQFFAERVDGIFQALSRTHVTNCPEGFGKRMILTGITSGFYSTERVGYINDLRAAVAKFMGRDEPKWNSSGRVVEAARYERGQWLTIDGGALRLRCYLNGNAHLEVHPDIAWRLNCVLAQLHPAAIPSKFRDKPKKVAREWQVIQRPLPFAVLEILEGLSEAYELVPVEPCRLNGWNKTARVKISNARRFGGYSAKEGPAMDEAKQVLAGLGGVQVTKKDAGTYWQFDYNPDDALRQVIASGCLPDVKSHQFYPTPADLARRVVELADIGTEHSCLEPSAGMGGLADFMPKDRTLCVELSPLHCEVLKSKGYEVTQADFLSWNQTALQFPRVVMNPPFSDGRWLAHVERAAKMVEPGGRLVAILPSGARNSLQLEGFSVSWHGPYSNEFPGVSIDVVILVADRGNK